MCLPLEYTIRGLFNVELKVVFLSLVSRGKITQAIGPIQGYRRHFVKGAKPLGRAHGQTNGDAFTMPKHARCCVGFCDNDKRFPNLLVVRSHVKELKFHRWPKDPNLAELWRKQVAKVRSDNFNPEPGSEGTFVCSNHFPEGTRTRHNPSTDYPSVFLTLSDFLNKPSPKKRKVSERLASEENEDEVTTAEGTVRRADKEDDLDHDDLHLRVPMRCEQISREADVKTFTGLPSTKCFKCIFDHLFPKAQHMQYWRGPKQTTREAPQDHCDPGIGLPKCRPGPGRKLDLEQEFLLTMMKLKLGLINEDLAFRFMVSSTTVSSVFITWIKLMSKELSVLII